MKSIRLAENEKLMCDDKDKLLSRRANIISMLESIRGSLKDSGIYVEQGNSRYKDIFVLGIRKLRSLDVNDEYSHIFSNRGQQLVRELFLKYASNTDGSEYGMTYRSFRTYLSAVGRSHELGDAVNSLESWTHYFKNTKALDNTGNIHTEGFLQYRASIENIYPLENDLKTLGMDLLPAYLVKWEKMKVLCESICKSNSGEIDEDEESNKVSHAPLLRELVMEAGSITPECLQYILGRHGEFYSIRQLDEMQHIHQHFLATMSELRKVMDPKWKLKKLTDKIRNNSSSSSCDPFNKNAFVAWVMSSRHKPPLDMVSNFIISFKLSIVRWIETLTITLQQSHNAMENLMKRKMFNLAYLAKIKRKHSTYEYKLKVNKKKEIPGKEKVKDCILCSTSLCLQYSYVEHSNRILRLMGMPRGAGTALVIEFTFEPDTPDTSRELLLRNVDTLFKNNFSNPLQAVPSFQGWKISQYEIKNNAKKGRQNVMRIGLSWNHLSSLDMMLRKLTLGFTLSDIMSGLKIDLHCSPSIPSIICDKKLSLNDVSLSSLSSISFGRELIVTLATEMLNQVRISFVDASSI